VLIYVLIYVYVFVPLRASQCIVEYIEHARRPPNHMTNRRAGVIPKTSSVYQTSYTSSVEPTSSPSSPTAQSSRFLLACMRLSLIVSLCNVSARHFKLPGTYPQTRTRHRPLVLPQSAVVSFLKLSSSYPFVADGRSRMRRYIPTL
jgi:hypothetical protein